MKTLANCNAIEFLQQTNKIRKEVEKYLKDTEILELRKRMPELTGDETAEEVEEKRKAQAKKNINDMLDLACDKYPKETAKILGLICFTDDAINVKGIDFLSPAIELMNNEAVLGFFTSLTKLGQTNIAG